MDDNGGALGQDGSADGQVGGGTRGRAAAGCIASPSVASLGFIHELVEDEPEAEGEDEAAGCHGGHGPQFILLGVDRWHW